jgi:hypothetical protein
VSDYLEDPPSAKLPPLIVHNPEDTRRILALTAERDALAAQLAAALEALAGVAQWLKDDGFDPDGYDGGPDEDPRTEPWNRIQRILSSPAAVAEAYTERVRQEAREACAKVAQSEPELPGEPGAGLLQAMRENPEDAARAVVRVTKRSIAAAIRARGQP